MMKPPIQILIFALFSLTATLAGASGSDAQDTFFETLSELCGEKFVGRTAFPDEPGEDWRDKDIVAHIETCDANQIRIPLKVGENTSRTWIITRLEDGLELKHDHRHEDGTPDEVTMYGGTTSSPGTALAQSFPADQHTAELLPEAATNEWFLSLSEDGQQMTYYLERHGKPRFKAVLFKQ